MFVTLVNLSNPLVYIVAACALVDAVLVLLFLSIYTGHAIKQKRYAIHRKPLVTICSSLSSVVQVLLHTSRLFYKESFAFCAALSVLHDLLYLLIFLPLLIRATLVYQRFNTNSSNFEKLPKLRRLFEESKQLNTPRFTMRISKKKTENMEQSINPALSFLKMTIPNNSEKPVVHNSSAAQLHPEQDVTLSDSTNSQQCEFKPVTTHIDTCTAQPTMDTTLSLAVGSATVTNRTLSEKKDPENFQHAHDELVSSFELPSQLNRPAVVEVVDDGWEMFEVVLDTEVTAPSATTSLAIAGFDVNEVVKQCRIRGYHLIAPLIIALIMYCLYLSLGAAFYYYLVPSQNCFGINISSEWGILLRLSYYVEITVLVTIHVACALLFAVKRARDAFGIYHETLLMPLSTLGALVLFLAERGIFAWNSDVYSVWSAFVHLLWMGAVQLVTLIAPTLYELYLEVDTVIASTIGKMTPISLPSDDEVVIPKYPVEMRRKSYSTFEFYEQCVPHKEFRDAFKKHLISQLCVEQFAFWELVQKYTRMHKRDHGTSGSESAKLAGYICNNFLKTNSPMEINDVAETRLAALKIFEDFITNKSSALPEGLFAILEARCHMQLKTDCFVRFTKTSEFSKIQRKLNLYP